MPDSKDSQSEYTWHECEKAVWLLLLNPELEVSRCIVSFVANEHVPTMLFWGNLCFEVNVFLSLFFIKAFVRLWGQSAVVVSHCRFSLACKHITYLIRFTIFRRISVTDGKAYISFFLYILFYIYVFLTLKACTTGKYSDMWIGHSWDIIFFSYNIIYNFIKCTKQDSNATMKPKLFVSCNFHLWGLFWTFFENLWMGSWSKLPQCV